MKNINKYFKQNIYNTQFNFMSIEIWIARDEDGKLHLFDDIPTAIYDHFLEKWHYEGRQYQGSLYIPNGKELLPEVTFMSGPQKVELILKK